MRPCCEPILVWDRESENQMLCYLTPLQRIGNWYEWTQQGTDIFLGLYQARGGIVCQSRHNKPKALIQMGDWCGSVDPHR